MLERASLAPQGSARLAERRRLRRRRILIALGVLLALLCAGIIYELNQSAVRISHVTVYGADQSLADIAAASMQGKYFGLVPRDSTFFFPDASIRAGIMAAHPDIAAVSIFHNGLTGLSIKVDERVPVAPWCGLAPTPNVEEYCYVFDAGGFIFAPHASTTVTINNFALYAPLAPLETPAKAGPGTTSALSLTGLAGNAQEPLRATVADSEKLPDAFDFARRLGTFGSPVVRVVIRGDEVDDMLGSGTRITYVLGNEENAFTALVSARDSFNLADGSIDYVDLRFGSKVYLKQKK